MRNKSEYVWIIVVLVICSVASFVLLRNRTMPPADAPVANVITPAPSSPAGAQADFPRSKAALSQFSFKIEKVRNEANGGRTVYTFFIHGAAHGADYEATLAGNGRTMRSNGQLSEAEYRAFVDGLEAHGVWKLVNVEHLRGDADRTSVYAQAGSWSNNVTFGPDYSKDLLAANFMQQVTGTLAGDQEKTLTSALSAK